MHGIVCVCVCAEHAPIDLLSVGLMQMMVEANRITCYTCFLSLPGC